MRSYLLLVSVLLCCAGNSQQRFLFTRFTVDNGLAGNHVNVTLRDEQGFLWIGTLSGLQRFDGNKFITIREYVERNSGLPERIDQIVAYDSRHLVLRSGNEVGFFNRSTFAYNPIPIQTKTRLKGNLYNLFRDSHGRLFLCLSKYSFLIYNPKTACFTDTEVPVTVPPNWPITHLFEDQQRGNYWIVSDSGLAVYNTTSKTVFYKNNNPANHALLNDLHAFPVNFLIDSQRRYWVVWWSRQRGPQVVVYNEATNQFLPTPRVLIPPKSGYYDLTHLVESGTGSIWAGGAAALLNYDSSKRAFLQNRDAHADDYGIRFGVINHLASDNEGGLWISTDEGLYLLYPRAMSQSGLVFSQATRNFTSLIQVSENELWAGTWGQGITFYDTLLKPYSTSPADSLRYYGMVWCLVKPKGSDRVWAGCQAGHVQIIHAATRRPLMLLKPPVFGGSTVFHVAEDRAGNLWFSTKSGRLVKWKKGDPIDTAHFTLIREFNTLIDALYFDKQGRLWITTIDRGVSVLNPDTGEIVATYAKGPQRETSLNSNIVSDMQQLNDSIFFINNEALSIFNKNTGRFSNRTVYDGLPSNNINSMVLDQTGILWLSTANGLCSYNHRTNRVTSYSKSSRLFNAAGMYVSLAAQHGKIFFGGEKLLFSFDPAIMNNHTVPPPVTLTDFKLFNRRLPVDSLLSLATVRFPHDQNSFTLSFSALNFLQQDKIVYYYKLEGAEKDWIRADKSLSVNYNLLPPGRYTFLVRTENSAGVTSKDTQLSILINVPFWLSWWFILLCCALFAGSVYLIYRQQIKQFLMIELVRQKVARDLHDDMGSVLSTINILSMMAKSKLGEDRAKTSEYLTKISDNSSRMMEAMDDIVWSINPANDSMDKIVARMRSFATEVLEAKDIDLQFTINGTIEDIHLDMEQRRDFFLIYKEAVNNIAKYAHCTKVRILLSFSRQTLQLKIEDDGLGFDVQQADTGNGLNNMRKRAENLGARFTITSELSRGTTICLQIGIT